MDHQKSENKRINTSPDITMKAKEGDAKSQLELGKAYFYTHSIENNSSIAFKYILRSAKQGNMEAQLRLGELYSLGYDGIIKSVEDAYKWYTKAAIQGYKKALVRIQHLYQQDIRIHCRGQLNHEEGEWSFSYFKEIHGFKELYEYRLEQQKYTLNGAIEYFTSQFKHYQSSDQEDPIVQLNLAFLYQHGYGVKKCSRWAFEYYELAANQGNIDAQYNLGFLYQKHANKKFNYRDAFKWYTKSAQGGNRAAQRCLAYFYLKGLATDINYERAIFWYTKAAEAGDPTSQVILGKLYRKGDYVKKDLPMAVKWYTLAAQQGNVIAQNCLSQLYECGILDGIQLEDNISGYIIEECIERRLCSKLRMDISKLNNSSKQLNELAKHALIGDGPAMYEIGLKYLNGDKEFIQNKDIGMRWIKNAAIAKHKTAQFMMADLYKEGDYVEQDYYKSCIWYKTIAKKRDAKARYHVGDMYERGLGVREDSLEASKWYTWSADQGNSDALYDFAMLRYYGKGLREDKEEAVVLLYELVRRKNIKACYELGYIHFNYNPDVKEKLEESLILLNYAARNGYEEAQKYLGSMYMDGGDLQQDNQKSIEYYTMAADLGDTNGHRMLAIVYLNDDNTDKDYAKIYSLFKQGSKYDSALFQIPMGYDSCIKDYSKVRDMFVDVTEKGGDDLSYNLGFLYEYGVVDYRDNYVFDINYSKAKEWYSRAAVKGDSRAEYRLGIMYECEKGVEKNMTTAVYHYNKARENDNYDAMYRLAAIYLNGYSVNQDLLQAYCLYTKTINMGHEPNSYDTEIPVTKEDQIQMLEKATEEGYTRLEYQLGVIYEDDNDDSMAFKWFKRATDLGVTDAYYRTGFYYEEGMGVEQDYTMAAAMYKKAIEKDHEDACYQLGRLYQYGYGVRLDYLKAYDLYKKAAEMGHDMASIVLNITLEPNSQLDGEQEESFFDVESEEFHDSITMCRYVAEHGNTEVQFKVGFAYEYSFPEPNYAEAFKWYSIATSNSYREAIYHLGLLYEHGLGVSQDYDKAIQLYNQASQLGSDGALFRKAIMYHHGKGVNIDQKKAMEYYTLSAEFGNPKYQCELGRLYEEGDIVQRNPLETLKWYTTAYIQGYDGISQALQSLYKDKAYEDDFFQKLFKILSIATRNQFKLSKYYLHEEYSGVNIRLGSLYIFGQGTKKNLQKAFNYFSMKYIDKAQTLISHFSFLESDNYTVREKNEILNEFETDKVFIDQLDPKQLYALGMLYYDGIVKTETTSEENDKKGYTPINDRDPEDLNQYIIIEKDHLKAFKYLKKAADKKYYEFMMNPFIFHYDRDIVKDDLQAEHHLSPVTNSDTTTISERVATLNKTQDFSKTIEWYNYLEKRLGEDKAISFFDQNALNVQFHNGWGSLYGYGVGVEQDYEKSMEHYKALSDTNCIVGLFQLGLVYYYGKGISVDYNKALDLFEKVDDGYSWVYKLVLMHDLNDLNATNYPKESIYCIKTTDEVRGESYYYLGLIYKHGQGVPEDNKKAQDYFIKAFELKCKRAENEIN